MEQIGTLLDHLLARYREELEALRGEVADLRQEIRRERPTAPALRSAVLRIRDVCQRSGLSRATIYRLEREGKWPRRLQLSNGRVGWDEAEVEARIAELRAARAGGSST